MSDQEKNETKPSNLLLFAMLDMIDIEEEPAMGQAIGKFKGLVTKLDPFASYNILRSKLKALLKVRDELLLRTGCPTPMGEDETLPEELRADQQQIEAERKRQPAKLDDFLEGLLQLLEDTSHSSDTYAEALTSGIEQLRTAEKIKQLSKISAHLIQSSNTMMEATNAFQAGIQEMATMAFDFQRKIRELETELREQKEIAMVDKLTGVANRRAFDLRLEETIAQSRRFHMPLSLFLLDMDHFKDINDNFGHDVGDEVLVSFARLLRTSCREYDIVFRFGGDEFAILLPNEGIDEGAQFAERIQQFMRNNAYRHKDKKINMSISGGISQLKEDDDGFSLLKRADQRLYEAKRRGRAQVCCD